MKWQMQAKPVYRVSSEAILLSLCVWLLIIVVCVAIWL